MAHEKLVSTIMRDEYKSIRVPISYKEQAQDKANMELIKSFLTQLGNTLEREKIIMEGEEGFCRPKDKQQFKNELEKQKCATGLNFREHCTVCNKIPSTLRGIKSGGYQKLYPASLSPTILLKALHMNTPYTEMLIQRTCYLSLGAFDCESLLKPVEDKASSYRTSISLFNKSYVGQQCKPVLTAPYQDLKYTEPQVKLNKQVVIFIGHIDSHRQEIEQKEPAIFGWDEKLQSNYEPAILKMVEQFCRHLMIRHMTLFRYKFEVLAPLFEFLKPYHEAVLNFYLAYHNLTLEQLFPPELNPLLQGSGVLTTLEEIFLSPSIFPLSQVIRQRAKHLDSTSKVLVKKPKISIAQVNSSFKYTPEPFNYSSESDEEEIWNQINLSGSDDSESESDSDLKFYKNLNDITSRQSSPKTVSVKEKRPKMDYYAEQAEDIIQHLIEIKNIWKKSILGQLEKTLIGLCCRMINFCLNLQSYDGPLLHTYLVSVCFSGYMFSSNPNRKGPKAQLNDSMTRQDLEQIFGADICNDKPPLSVRLSYYYAGQLFSKPKIQRNGLKINRITLATGCHLCESSLITSPGYSLEKLAELTGTKMSKGIFPFSKLTSLEFLKETKLPSSPYDWLSDLGPQAANASDLELLRSGNKQEQEEALRRQNQLLEVAAQKRDLAMAEFQRLKCPDIQSYFLFYLKKDCLILLEIMNILRQQFRSILDLDFIELGVFTLSSYSFDCIQFYLNATKRWGFRCINQALCYSATKNCYLGGISQVGRTVAGREADVSPYFILNEKARKWNKKYGGFSNIDPARRLAKRKVQAKKREMEKNPSITPESNLYVKAATFNQSSSSNSDAGSTTTSGSSEQCERNNIQVKTRHAKRKRNRKRKLRILNGHLYDEIKSNQNRILKKYVRKRMPVSRCSMPEKLPKHLVDMEEIVYSPENFRLKKSLDDLYGYKPNITTTLDINSLYGKM